MIRVSNQNSKNESTYIIHHGFVPILISKDNRVSMSTICINGLETNVNNINLSECNIALTPIEEKSSFTDYLKELVKTYGDNFFVAKGNLYSDIDLTNFIIKVEKGE